MEGFCLTDRSADRQRQARRDRFLGNVVWTLQSHLAHLREALHRG